MNQHVEAAANYVTDKVYPDHGEDHRGMKLAVSRLLDIILLNAGIVVSTYCMSASLSLLALLMTGSSGFFVYKIVRKIYVDIRTDVAAGITPEKASYEFVQIMNLATGTCWRYAAWGASQMQELAKTHT